MLPKQKAKELVSKLKPHMYCFMGSGMLTNTYDEQVALSEAKKCALMWVEEIIKSIPMQPYLNSKEHGVDMHSEDFWEDVKGWLSEDIKNLMEE